MLKTLPGSGHSATVVDVSDSKQVTEWIVESVRKHTQLNGAANIAGINPSPTIIKNETDENFKQIMSTNAFGVFHCLRAQLNHIDPSGGSIVSPCNCSRRNLVSDIDRL